MATKRPYTDNENHQKVKRALSDQETQLLPYNNSGFTMQVENNVRKFTPITTMQTQHDMSWQSMVLANFQALDFSAINYYYSDLQYLKDKFTELQGLSNYYDWRKRERPEEMVCIMEPAIGKTTYTIGLRVKGRPNGFAIADFGTVHRSKSNFGQFLSNTWSGIHEHNSVFGKIMDKYYNYEYPLKLESSVCIHLPEKENEREIRARQFLLVKRDNNPELYATGQLNRPLEVIPMTLTEFDQMFETNKTDGPSQEVPVLICGRIDGVKYGREIQMTDIDGRKFNEKPYYLAFKPVFYLIFEQ